MPKATYVYIDDWLSSTDLATMTAEQYRGYDLFLKHANKQPDGMLLNQPSELGRLTLLGTRGWKTFCTRYAHLLKTTADGSKIYNPKQLEGWKRSQKTSEERSKTGEIGAKKRWQNDSKRHGKTDGKDGSQTDGKVDSRLIDLKKEEKNPPLPPPGGSVRVEPDGYAEWYATYPRKVGRSQGATAWRQLNKAGLARLRETWESWRAEFLQRPNDKVPYPASFIRGRTWEDPPPAPRRAVASSTVEHREPEPLPPEEAARVREEFAREFPNHPDLERQA